VSPVDARAWARWPGPDGVVALLASALVALAWALGSSHNMGTPVALAVGTTALWLFATRPDRPVVPSLAPGVRPLVVIPTHGNAGTVGDVVGRCRAIHPDVLVVDDGSADASAEVARAAGAIVVSHPVNRGKGAALNTGLAWAAEHGFTHIVAIDADGQHLTDDLPAFLAALRDEPAAIHAGVRRADDMPRGARGARANSNFWAWVATGRHLHDTQCGYRAYPVRPTLAFGLPPSRYQWEVEVLVRAEWAGLPVHEVPCRVYYPPAEERVSSYRKVVDSARVTWLFAWLIAERVLWVPGWWARPTAGDWRGQTQGSLAGWRFLLGVVRVIGRRAALVGIVPLAAFYWASSARFRAGVDAYLRRRLPDRGALARSWLALRVMVEFAWALVDRFVLMVHGADALAFDRSEVPDLRDALYREKRGVLLLSAHVGNPELASAGLRGGPEARRVNVVMHVAPGDPYVALLREAGDRAPNVISLDDPEVPASIAILQALRRDEVVALKIDRPVDERVAPVDLLGAPILVPTGPMLLAGLSGAQVVLVGCFREPGGTYRLVATPPRVYRFQPGSTRDADAAAWTAELIREVEAWTARWPLQWFNFHDPWAHTPPPGEKRSPA